MKVSEMGRGLCVGDVVIAKIELQRTGYIEMLVTWIRRLYMDGERDANDPNDFDVQLMDNNGEINDVIDVVQLNDWEYSHNAFKFGAHRD